MVRLMDREASLGLGFFELGRETLLLGELRLARGELSTNAGEGMGRTWYAPWSSASAYALPIQAGAKMTQMENRIVLCR